MKKIISIGLAIMMVLAFGACGQDNEVAEYRTTAKRDLTIYVEGLNQGNYTSTNWILIEEYVEEGKAAIDAATDKLAIDAAVKAAKQSIDAIYTLSDELEAYKITAKTALETYAKEKGEDNYTVENWAVICSLVEEGKSAIDAATNKDSVDFAIAVAKQSIDAIDTILMKDEMLLKQFDSTDPTIFWEGNIDDDFADDRVVVVLKRTTTYPELGIRHFGLDNGERLEYLWLKPNGNPPSDFRQILVIYLKQHGKEKIVEAIKELEKLSFVKAAEPSYNFGTTDD